MSAMPRIASELMPRVNCREVPKSEVTGSFDHLVGAGKQGRRHLDAESFGRPQLDDQFEQDAGPHLPPRRSRKARGWQRPSRNPYSARSHFATLRATMLSGLIPVRKCFHHFLDLRHPSVERTDGVSNCSQWSGYSLHVRDDPLNFRTEPIELFICRKRSPLLVVH